MGITRNFKHLDPWHKQCSRIHSSLTEWKEMLRITESSENDTVVRLRLDGTVSAEAYKDFEQILMNHEWAGEKTIIVDLAGVNFMNDESARKIAAIQSEELRVINCSPYIEALLLKAAELVQKQ
jgi:anti-anti-sigma regulatory factor